MRFQRNDNSASWFVSVHGKVYLSTHGPATGKRSDLTDPSPSACSVYRNTDNWLRRCPLWVRKHVGVHSTTSDRASDMKVADYYDRPLPGRIAVFVHACRAWYWNDESRCRLHKNNWRYSTSICHHIMTVRGSKAPVVHSRRVYQARPIAGVH